MERFVASADIEEKAVKIKDQLPPAQSVTPRLVVRICEFRLRYKQAFCGKGVRYLTT